MILNSLRSGLIGGLMLLGAGFFPVSAQTTTTSDGWATMLTADALEMFVDVCGGSLPNFENPDSKLNALDFKQADTGTWYLRGRDLSIKIKPIEGYGNVCSTFFGTAEDQTKIASAFSHAFPSMRPTENDNVGKFGDTNASVIFYDDVTQQGQILYLHVEMLPVKN